MTEYTEYTWNDHRCFTFHPDVSIRCFVEQLPEGRALTRADGIRIAFTVILRSYDEFGECALWPKEKMSLHQFMMHGKKQVQRMHLDFLVELQADYDNWKGEDEWTLNNRLQSVQETYNAASWRARDAAALAQDNNDRLRAEEEKKKASSSAIDKKASTPAIDTDSGSDSSYDSNSNSDSASTGEENGPPTKKQKTEYVFLRDIKSGAVHRVTGFEVVRGD